MRSDMSKVLVERPRLRIAKKGRGSHYPRAALARPYGPELDDAPTKCGITWRHKDKWLNENLAPLRRFLLSRVGRPWANVYAELSANVCRDSAVQAHIFQHIDDYVARNVELRVVPGTRRTAPFRTDGYKIGWVVERPRWGLQLYVCPKSGVLRRAKRADTEAPRFGRAIRVNDGAELRQVDGVWKVVELRPIDPVRLRQRALHDALLDAALDLGWFDESQRYQKMFGRNHVYAVRIREPGKRELKHIARDRA